MKKDNEETSISLEDAYIKNEKLLLYVANQILHNNAEVEDAIQDAMYKIVKYCPGITFKNETKAQNFLARTVKNSALDMYNKNKAKQITSLDTDPTVMLTADDRNSPEQYTVNQESVEELICEIKKMDPKYLAVLKYLKHDKMTIVQVSQIMGISKRTVSYRLESALQYLRNTIGKVGR